MLIIAKYCPADKNNIYCKVSSFHDNIYGVTNVVEDLTSGLLRRNPAGGQSGIELGGTSFQVQRYNHAAMLPPAWFAVNPFAHS